MSGAFLGAARRRLPKAAAPLVVSRARYQLELWRAWRREGVAFGPRTFVAFARGLLRGVLLRPPHFIAPVLRPGVSPCRPSSIGSAPRATSPAPSAPAPRTSPPAPSRSSPPSP